MLFVLTHNIAVILLVEELFACAALRVYRADLTPLLNDKNMVQMMLALRLCFPDAGIVLSTRENAAFRDHMINICVTRLSAGSKTNPGGYSSDKTAAEQFTIDDDRIPAAITRVIQSHGHEPVWKDWDTAFSANKNATAALSCHSERSRGIYLNSHRR